MLKKALILLAIMLPMTGVASNNTPPDSLRCVTDSCKAKYKEIHELALYGHPSAQLLLGVAYLDGDGVEQDNKKALKWLTKAKRGGSTKAVWLLSRLYRAGALVEQDTKRADNLLARAIKREYGPALYDKAVSLFNFDNKQSADNQQAIALLKKAKAQGFKQAAYLYAKMLETGTLVDMDLYDSAVAYKNLGDYRDSQARFDFILGKAKGEISVEKQVKFDYLKDMEVISVEYNRENFDAYLGMLIKAFKEDSQYDNRGGMSHIVGRTCSAETRCGLYQGEDLDLFLFGIARKRY